MGPVEHSAYANAVRISVEAERVIVRGWESAGRYAEVLDARTGAILGNWRAQRDDWTRTGVPADVEPLAPSRERPDESAR